MHLHYTKNVTYKILFAGLYSHILQDCGNAAL